MGDAVHPKLPLRVQFGCSTLSPPSHPMPSPIKRILLAHPQVAQSLARTAPPTKISKSWHTPSEHGGPINRRRRSGAHMKHVDQYKLVSVLCLPQTTREGTMKENQLNRGGKRKTDQNHPQWLFLSNCGKKNTTDYFACFTPIQTVSKNK